jgi:hypothetical protein
MLIDYKNGQGSVVLRVKLRNSSVSTGAGLTGLTSASAGLVISTIADNEATATTYTVAGSTIESITTLGTYATPTATKCRFKELDATNHPGIYEVQIADARFAVSSAKSLLVSLGGATNLAQCDVVVPLRSVDPYDAVRFGMTALPAVASGNAGAVIASGTGTGQLSVSGGVAQADAAKVGGQTASASGTVTFPNATLASTTNITAGTIGTVSGNVNGNVGGNVTGSVGSVASGGITAASLAADCITAAKVADGAIDAATFAAGAIDASAIATDAITATKIAADAIGASELAATAVAEIAAAILTTPANLLATDASGRVTVGSLASGSITSTVIAADAIGASELAADAVAEIAAAILSTPANLLTTDGSGRVTVGSLAAGSITSAVVATDAIDADALAADAVSEIQSGLATASALTTVGNNVSTLLGRVTSTLFSGITSLASWLGALMGKAADSTTQTEIRATTAGAGYTVTTDSLEALRDNVGTNGAALSLAKTTNITGFNDLSTAQVNAEADTALADVGLTSAVTGRIDAAVSSRAAASALPANFSLLAINGAGRVDVGLWLGVAPLALSSQRVQATASVSLTQGDIDAIAAGVADAALDDLTAIRAKTDLIAAGGSVTVVAPVSASGAVEVVAGDDYAAADGRALSWTNTAGSWPNLTGASVRLNVRGSGAAFEAAGSVVTPTGTGQEVRVALTAAQTGGLTPQTYEYDVRVTLSSGRVAELARGRFVVLAAAGG